MESPWQQHVISRFIIRRNVGEAHVLAFMRAQIVEGLADAGEHAEREHVDLHQAERVDVVLVPFDEGALRHGGVADGRQFVEPPARQHEAADMLRKMTRKTEQPLGEMNGAADDRDFRDQAPSGEYAPAEYPIPKLPHCVLASAVVTSSVRPKTLPTSRMALRGR